MNADLVKLVNEFAHKVFERPPLVPGSREWFKKYPRSACSGGIWMTHCEDFPDDEEGC